MLLIRNKQVVALVAAWSCFLAVLAVQRDKYPSLDELAYRLHKEKEAVVTVRRAPRGGPGPLMIGSRQDRYDHIIKAAAEEYEVDFYIIKGIIKAESHFNPRAVSPRGARGLMQLMPATARSLGVKDVFSPRENIFAGVRYFRKLLDVFDGDHQLALAAYNAGVTTVRTYGGIPPFPVTRTYLGKVFTYAEEFKTS